MQKLTPGMFLSPAGCVYPLGGLLLPQAWALKPPCGIGVPAKRIGLLVKRSPLGWANPLWVPKNQNLAARFSYEKWRASELSM